MKRRLARLIAFSLAGAFAATLAEGASSRIALSGGPVARENAPSERAASAVVRRPPATIQPLQPGQTLVLGPIADPLSAPPIPAPVAPPAPPLLPGAAAVDTVTVRAPASAPEAPRSPAATESWETYRSGNVVRIALP